MDGQKKVKNLRYKKIVSIHIESVLLVDIHQKKSLKALMAFDGYTNTCVFSYWVEHFLCSVISNGDVVVMDNAKFHKNHCIKALIEAKGARLLFLPTYSPDLNPIA